MTATFFEVINFTEEGADMKMMKKQSHDRVRQMLDLLPEDQREVIILRHYADLSFKEIASLTNCSINTALGRMRYGLINLRKNDDAEKDRLIILILVSLDKSLTDDRKNGNG